MSKRILVVEDQEDNRRILRDYLTKNGFEVLEIACWPKATGPVRRYAGTSHIDVVNASEQQLRDIRAEVEGKGLSISGLGYYPNPLHPDPETRRAMIDHITDISSLSREDAYLLCSLCVDLKISEIVDAGEWIVSALLPEAVFTG